MSDAKVTGIQNPSSVVVVVGLALGGILGMLGTMVAARNLQSAFWAVDGVALVAATAILAVKYLRAGNDCVAAGFLVFSIGEGLMLIGTATTLSASAPSFAAGAALWSAGLMLASVPGEFAGWVRVAGVIASILFAITSARIFWGAQIVPVSRPLPYFAYPFLVLTLAGWIWKLLRSS